MIETAFTRLVPCRIPLQLAAMGGVSTPELAAAVAGAGGLGMLVPDEDTAGLLDGMAERARGTGGAYGVNFLVPFLDRAALEAASSRCRVVEFFFGNPVEELVARVHDGGALAAWQVGSADEAVAAEQAGCDFLVAQGVEAGGHVRGTVPRDELLEQVLRRVGLPVLAAGGIGTPDDVVRMLQAGAAGVRVGTRFVASAESAAHPRYVEALIGAEADDTVLTTAFSVGWPDAPHRVLRSCLEEASSCLEEARASGGSQRVATERFAGSLIDVPPFSALPPSRTAEGRVEAMALYAGRSVGAVERVRPAADLVAELVSGLERLSPPASRGARGPRS